MDRDLAIFLSIIGLVVVLICWAATSTIQSNQIARTHFMADCQKDHKEYECTAMWRAGNNKGSDVVVIPMYTGR